MLKQFPENGMDIQKIHETLDELGKNDIKNSRGRLFTYFYDPGIDELNKLQDIFLKFSNRNGMDYHAFPSTLKLENDVIAMMASLLHGKEGSAGTFTTGGTESIILAMKAARDRFFEKHHGVPEVILPVTAHPSFSKAVEYLGLKEIRLPVDEHYLADPELMRKAITENTAMIVGSAPSFPYGTIDPIKELSDIALENNLWLHVDACVGGMILPFLKRLGHNVQDFDFTLPGVSSISVDLHKYGFTPKGSSVIMYKNEELRKHQIYVNAKWPGYPMSNAGMQATKSAGPLAGTWAIMNYLGYKGYTELASKTLSAYKTLTKGIENIGYEITGKPDATIFAFQDNNNSIFTTGVNMIEKGWYPQIQPSNLKLGLPSTIHLNVCPVHVEVADEFLSNLENIHKNAGKDSDSRELAVESRDKAVDYLVNLIEQNPEKKTLFFHMIYNLDPEKGEEIFRKITDMDFHAAEE
jgi:glutamate/tyrosine decarboxylase-like PLP-dependent enzyme